MDPNFLEKTYVKKGWGYEYILVNNDLYCGKILHFDSACKFSMHFHVDKDETWYVNYGTFTFRWIDCKNADINERILTKGDVVNIPRTMPHQLQTVDGGEIFEVSTHHEDSDSYRVMKGDSQTKKATVADSCTNNYCKCTDCTCNGCDCK
jgi:mannose-6-phosphate isomerase-like protein (cupin superfamily)